MPLEMTTGKVKRVIPTLRECMEAMYDMALSNIKERFQREALTEDEVRQEFGKNLDKFVEWYTVHGISSFECVDSIFHEYFDRVRQLENIQFDEIEFTVDVDGIRVPSSEILYGDPKYFESKIESIKKAYITKANLKPISDL